MEILRRRPRFRRLLAALAVSQAGDWLYNLALLAFVYSETRSTALVGLTTAARVAPIVVAGPLGGVLADRVDRRKLMLASDALRAGFMAALAAVAVLGLPVLLAPVLAALTTLAAGVHMPCVAATTPRLVADDELPAANALRSVVGQASIVAGPALGAVLLLLGPPSAAFAVNALTFGLSALAILSIPAGPAFAAPERPEAAPRVFDDLRAGARALRGQPRALALFGGDVVCSAVYGALTVLLLLVSRDLGTGDHGYGYLLAAFGLGGILGAAALARLGDRATERGVMAAALLAVAASLALLAVAPGLGAALAVGVIGGVGSILVEILAETGLQRSLAPDVFARAYGLALPASLAAIAAGSLVAAPLVAAVGLHGALVVLAAAVAAYAVALAPGRAPAPAPAAAVAA
jgi:MFS family permease